MRRLAQGNVPADAGRKPRSDYKSFAFIIDKKHVRVWNNLD